MRKNRKLTITKFMDSMNKIYKTTEYKDIVEPFDKSKSFTDKYSCVNNGVFAAAMKKIILANGGTEPTNVPLYKDNDALSSEVFDFYIEEYAKIKGYVAPIDPSDDEENVPLRYRFEMLLNLEEGTVDFVERSGKPKTDLVEGMVAEVFFDATAFITATEGNIDDVKGMCESEYGWDNITANGNVVTGEITSIVCNTGSHTDRWISGEEVDGVYKTEIHNGDIIYRFSDMTIAINKGYDPVNDWTLYRNG